MNVLNNNLEDFRYTENGQIIQGAAHTSRILNHKYRNQVIIKSYTFLKKLDLWYDAIACCGTSGLMVVPQIAELLKKNIIMVRKDTNSYSNFIVEGPYAHQYIIVDDLICSGGTAKRIIKSIKQENPKSKCVGIYTYMPEECAYRNRPDLCKRDLGIQYLNHCPQRT